MIVILVIIHFGFEGRTLVLIAQVSGHCLPLPKVEKAAYFLFLYLLNTQLVSILSTFNDLTYLEQT